MLDAGFDMVFEHHAFDPAERSAHRLNLCHDVDAVAVLFHHAGDAAHLAFDPGEAGETTSSGGISHGLTLIPQGGIRSSQAARSGAQGRQGRP